MDIRFNKKKLADFLEDVYVILKTPISIFDSNFQFVTSYPPPGYLTDFCSMIRASEDRAQLCKRSDEESCALCKKNNRTFSYLCHAGICETIVPILFDGSAIGYIIFGEYKIKGVKTNVKEYAQENGINADALSDAYERLTSLTENEAESMARILEACVLKFWMSDAILLRTEDIAGRIKQFIDENIYEPLTVDELCKSFFISRQRLYTIFKDNFNTTVKKYVLERKLSRAKQLLRTTDYSITEITEKTGFADYNNFIQRFRHIVGKTPLEYRREQKQNG